MNVLYVLNYAGHGGTEKYVELMMERLKPYGVKSYFAWNLDGKLSETIQKENVPHLKFVMRSPLDLIAAFQLATYCKKEKIEVIHTNFLRENYIAVLSKLFYRKPKVIYTNHVMLQNNKLLQLFNKLLTPFDHKIIAVCTLGKDMMKDNKVDGSKIEVVFNGVDIKQFDIIEPSSLREELGVDNSTIVISCLSRFDEFKGNKFLIDSIEVLKKRNLAQKFLFVLANEGPLWEEMKALANEKGLTDSIRFIGFRKDIKNILTGSDFYVNPSEWEALSFAIIEALGCGLPVVSTDTGGTPDIINEGNDCGMLVPYLDTQKMADTLQHCIESPGHLETMSHNAKKIVRSTFDIEQMIEKTYKLYN